MLLEGGREANWDKGHFSPGSSEPSVSEPGPSLGRRRQRQQQKESGQGLWGPCRVKPREDRAGVPVQKPYLRRASTYSQPRGAAPERKGPYAPDQMTESRKTFPRELSECGNG